MTGKLSKNFHGVGIGPLSKILAVKTSYKIGFASLNLRALNLNFDYHTDKAIRQNLSFSYVLAMETNQIH